MSLKYERRVVIGIETVMPPGADLSPEYRISIEPLTTEELWIVLRGIQPALEYHPPLFAERYCVECGGKFGPGNDLGYTKCSQHVEQVKTGQVGRG
jgi:hypothetical protein